MKANKFEKKLENIFPTERTLTVVGSEKTLSAKVNTPNKLSSKQVKGIVELANESNLDFNIKRSGAGLRIEFN